MYAAREPHEEIYAATFSIAAGDPRTGDFGVAVSTAVPGVGAVVPWVSVNAAVATQAMTNGDLGRIGIACIDLGMWVDHALPALLQQDERRENRQLHGVDRLGRTFAHTGKECVPWAGHLTDDRFTVAGNMLVGPQVIEAMADAFRKSDPELELCERLLLALEAGQAGGGDKRGKQSAALLVASPSPQFYHNLRVDEHADPVAELRRVFGVARQRAEERRRNYGALGTAIRVKL